MQFWLEFSADLACLIVSNLISYIVFHFLIFRIAAYPTAEWLRYFAAMLLAFVIVYTGFYSKLDIRQRNRTKELMALLRNASLTYLMFSAFILLIKSPILDSRYMLMSGFLGYVLLLMPERYFLKRWITGSFTKSKTASLAGIITTSDIAEEFVKGVKQDWTLNITGIMLADNVLRHTRVPAYAGAADSAASVGFPDSVCDIPVICTDESFMESIRALPFDEIFININYSDNTEIQALVEELEDMGITVHLHIPGLTRMLDESKFDNINCKMYAGYPMATFSAAKNSDAAMAVKRSFDILISLIGCPVALLAMALVAIPLKKESPGPLMFKQERVGKNGRSFYIYKIRSMYPDAEERLTELQNQNEMNGNMFKIMNDPRITKVGAFIRKYSIDELPQFFNVLKGDMSFIGTRPPTWEEFRQYEGRHKRRLSMRPGITGMWQVSGRNEITDFEQVVALDCQYIDEWSLLLDIKIFFKTIYVVLTHRGAG